MYLPVVVSNWGSFSSIYKILYLVPTFQNVDTCLFLQQYHYHTSKMSYRRIHDHDHAPDDPTAKLDGESIFLAMFDRKSDEFGDLVS